MCTDATLGDRWKRGKRDGGGGGIGSDADVFSWELAGLGILSSLSHEAQQPSSGEIEELERMEGGGNVSLS